MKRKEKLSRTLLMNKIKCILLLILVVLVIPMLNGQCFFVKRSVKCTYPKILLKLDLKKVRLDSICVVLDGNRTCRINTNNDSIQMKFDEVNCFDESAPVDYKIMLYLKYKKRIYIDTINVFNWLYSTDYSNQYMLNLSLHEPKRKYLARRFRYLKNELSFLFRTGKLQKKDFQHHYYKQYHYKFVYMDFSSAQYAESIQHTIFLN